jgi:hypothetical protein
VRLNAAQRFGFPALAALLIITWSRSLCSVPAPLLNVTELYQQSDIVVIGQVQTISIEGPTFIDRNSVRIPGRVMHATLLIDKLIKGDPQSASLSCEFFQPDHFMGFRPIPKGQYGMFFLKSSPSNVVSVTSPHYPYIVALPDRIETNEVGLSRVAQELAIVLNSTKTTLEQKLSSVEAMETVKSPSVNTLLKDAFQISNEQLKLGIASALLKRGDTTLLEYAVNSLLTPSQSVDPNQLFRLALSIESGIHDPDSLPQLVRLLNMKEARLRRPIAAAIRSTKSQSAIDPLSSLLEDTDPDIRYVAVIGLAEITEQHEWAPAKDEFQNNEQRYLDYWKEWSKSRQN